MRLLLLAALALLATLPAVAAQRVVSLAPSLSEIMLELDAVDRLAGVLDGGERPAALAQVPSVGRYGQVEMETLLSLRPDLVLLWPDSVPRSQREQLQQFGIPVLVVAQTRLDGLAEQFRVIGQAVDRTEQGERLAEAFRAGLAELRTAYARERPARVFYQIWNRPLYTLGGQQIISEAIEVCGGQNIFADLTLAAPQVSIEAVLARDPEVILAGSGAQLDEWQAWPQLDAVRNGRLLEVPDKGLERPSFQMLGAIRKLCEVMAAAP